MPTCALHSRVGTARAGPYQSWRWRLGPARFGSYDDASIATAQAACHAPASEAVTAVTGYSSSTHHFLDAPAPMHFLDKQRSVR